MKKRGFNKTLILALCLIIALELILLGFDYNFESTGNLVKKIVDDVAGAKQNFNVKTQSPSTQTAAKTATTPTIPTPTVPKGNTPMQPIIPTKATPSKPEFDGYIVQLKDDPVGQYQIKQSANYNAKALSTNAYRQNLIQTQKIVEDQIKQINPNAIVSSKVQNVFNGFAVKGISEQDLVKIKSLTDVKQISPNYKVYTKLMDSVPLIGADKVWNTQINGTNLTGKGVRIGIIDTGVDYTHPNFCLESSNKLLDLDAIGVNFDIDSLNEKVYWTEGGSSIYSANLDGSNYNEVLRLEGEKIGKIKILKNKIFWASSNKNKGLYTINIANLDGKELKTMPFLDISITDFSIDEDNNKLYLLTTNSISRVNLDGTEEERINFWGDMRLW